MLLIMVDELELHALQDHRLRLVLLAHHLLLQRRLRNESVYLQGRIIPDIVPAPSGKRLCQQMPGRKIIVGILVERHNPVRLLGHLDQQPFLQHPHQHEAHRPIRLLWKSPVRILDAEPRFPLLSQITEESALHRRNRFIRFCFHSISEPLTAKIQNIFIY